MRRRDVLTGAAASAAGSTALAAPAIAQAVRQLTMVTDWPETLPGLLPSARRLAQAIGEASGGRLKIEVFASGALVRPFETFDAVQAGVADMFHSFIGYFEKKSQAFHFYAGIPFGLTANELSAWVDYGGGQALWDELGAQFNIKPLHCMSTGCQMGGWFNSEVTSLEGFKGLRYRMAGPGAEVLRRLGAIVVVLPGGDIVPSLKSGAIDACEWVGPWLDMAMGLHQAAGYYYYPAWHEPGTAQTLGINRRVWESLSTSDQRLIEACAAAEYTQSLAEFNAQNARSLQQLRDEGRVKILQFNDSLLKAFRDVADDVVAQAATDGLYKRIATSYDRFRAAVQDWGDVSERPFLNSRGFG
jgi:TRAP-type mannitol/chloroaromatic compound transport system substrate-binding protein